MENSKWNIKINSICQTAEKITLNKERKKERKAKNQNPKNVTYVKTEIDWLVKRENSRYILFIQATPENLSVGSQSDLMWNQLMDTNKGHKFVYCK